MQFQLEQHFTADLVRVEAAYLDPAFLTELSTLPKLGRPTLLSQRQAGELVYQRVRYAFVGQLSSAVRAVVDPARLTWVQESKVDCRTHQTEFAIVPDHYVNLLEAKGTFTLEPVAGSACRRITDGTVRVAMPLVGRKVEAAIVSGLAEHAEAETDVLMDWLGSAV